MAIPIKVLIVEDSVDDAMIISYELERGGFKQDLQRVDTEYQMKTALETGCFDIIISDYVIPNFGGIPALKLARKMGCDLPFIMTSGVIGEETAVDVMQAGAQDFISKSNYARLVPAINRELKEYRVRKERERELIAQKNETEKQRQLALQMVHQNPKPLLLMKKNLDIKLVNEAYITMSGFSEESLLRMNAKSFKVISKSGHGIREALETKKGVTGEIEVDFPTGVHFLEQHTIPLLDEEGNVVSIMVVYSDLTEKRAIDAELKQTMDEISRLQKQTETMIKDNPLAIAVMKADKTPLTINAEYERLWRGSREELLRKKISDFTITRVGGEDFYHSFETRSRAISELEVLFQDGTKKYVMLFQIPVLDESGQIEVNFYMYLDITAQTELARYRGTYIKGLLANMKRISQGDFNLNLTLEKANEHTKNAYEDFVGINQSLTEMREALATLIKDTQDLAQAALDGRLNVRADANRHQGDFRKVIDGVNKTLDSVVVPVTEALIVSQEYARTNFTIRFNPEIKVAGDWIAFKEALDNIAGGVAGAVSLVNHQVLDLAAAAEEANAGVEEVSAGSAQVAKNSARVSSNSEKGRDGIIQILKAMDDLNATVGDVSTKAESVSKLAQEANVLSKNGAVLAKKADAGMGEITRNSTDVATIVNDIKAQMDQIGKIVNVITGLANQTNLLALNAAIEAARAGDAGRGFAVVATEVKSLAQESRSSAQNIGEMIATLQSKSLKAASAVAETEKTVKEGSSALTDTLSAFSKIVAAIESINKNMEEVAGASQEQAASVEEITASINEVNGLIENTAKEAFKSASASEQASAAIDQVSSIIGNVTSIVDNL
ncbi:MAG: methyl-accepting chemotaxis protein, partial [Methanomicrobiales archaeon]|nr:methyl-accepting chemotaxis protein [Methanomicrobiales archaeon]